MIIILLNILSISTPYYYNPKIHNLGNIGIGGKLHANLAYTSTKIIDNIRYNGRNIRKEIYQPYLNKNKSILDLCCGVGLSTPSGEIGIDTSYEMLDIAKKNAKIANKNTKFYFGNAESFRLNKQIDIVTCMFAFHEMPNYAHIRIIQNALMITKEEFVIVDIAPNYKNKNLPEIMLKGEPYLINYLNTINDILYDFEETIYIPNHVHIWKYKK